MTSSLYVNAKSVIADVRLIPWDPDSPTHRERMNEERVTCGWKAEMIVKWFELQRLGNIAIQWIVLTTNDPNQNTKLEAHIKAHPKERSTLKDTAKTLIGKPRDPTYEISLPVGHIGLNLEYECPGHDDGTEGCTGFQTYIYISLQGSGLGRAAMDAVERAAIAESLNAKVLALSTVAPETNDIKEQWAALGRQPPKLTNQVWYGSRGYVPYKKVEGMWSEQDKTGNTWLFPAVLMRKAIA